MDKATVFLIKIHNKNQLRQFLRQKKEVYDQVKDDAPETAQELHQEIQAIELEIANL